MDTGIPSSWTWDYILQWVGSFFAVEGIRYIVIVAVGLAFMPLWWKAVKGVLAMFDHDDVWDRMEGSFPRDRKVTPSGRSGDLDDY